ncbi:hypothetical protein THTE_3317 [Thermogutta terrifontis]|uniref:Uncharacterized protein n=1 Tax=Thermogutta terrifontis TaxID=1331910 RepID=A0A286RIY1_9BACT|nr:hypothetical protein THTE_3317 [Thermogutta terrifontis]
MGKLLDPRLQFGGRQVVFWSAGLQPRFPRGTLVPAGNPKVQTGVASAA